MYVILYEGQTKSQFYEFYFKKPMPVLKCLQMTVIIIIIIIIIIINPHKKRPQ